MSKEKQIEEIAFMLGDVCNHAPMDVCATTPCNHCRADYLYNAGYRKQSEGEWKRYSSTMMECSVCKRHTAYHRYEFCPHCGVKMKGGVE